MDFQRYRILAIVDQLQKQTETCDSCCNVGENKWLWWYRWWCVTQIHYSSHGTLSIMKNPSHFHAMISGCLQPTIHFVALLFFKSFFWCQRYFLHQCFSFGSSFLFHVNMIILGNNCFLYLSVILILWGIEYYIQSFFTNNEYSMLISITRLYTHIHTTILLYYTLDTNLWTLFQCLFQCFCY